MARWMFVRHATSEANRQGRLAGRSDAPLSSEGREQARLLAQRLSGLRPVRVWSSPLRRALDTARALDLGEPVVVEALVERDVGRWEGEPRSALREDGRMERLLGWRTRPPGGESQEEVARRVLGWLARCDPGDRAVVVTHAGVLRACLGLLDGIPREEIGRWRIPTAGVLERRVEPGRWRALLRYLEAA